MGFVNYSISLLLIAVFIIAMLTFAVNFGTDNNTNVNLGSDEDYNTINTQLKNNLSEFYTGTGVASESFQKSTISSTTDATEGGTQFKVTPWTSLAMVKTSLEAGWNRIFGKYSEFAVVLTALISALTFVMIMYAYAYWRRGG
jgi:hypothetical protein